MSKFPTVVNQGRSTGGGQMQMQNSRQITQHTQPQTCTQKRSRPQREMISLYALAFRLKTALTRSPKARGLLANARVAIANSRASSMASTPTRIGGRTRQNSQQTRAQRHVQISQQMISQ